MSEDQGLEDNAAIAGIEYGGWGLLLLFFLKRLCTIARNNGLYLEFSSPCRVNCKFDTQPNGRRRSEEGEEEDDDEDEEEEESEDGLELSDVTEGLP